MITRSLQSSVGIYRRYLSPHKGFRCAFAAEHGRLSCSDWAVRILKRKGGVQFLLWLPRRFGSCKQSHLRLALLSELHAQTGITSIGNERDKSSSDVAPSAKKEGREDNCAEYWLAEVSASCCCAALPL